MAGWISSPRLVGRAEELARLGAALERVAAGDPAAVLVAGEAGVGKTRLVTEFAIRAAGAGASVLAGGCVALVEGELAYAPLVEVLRDLVRRLDPAAVAALLTGDRGGLARLLPELGESDQLPPDPDLAGEMGQARLFGSLLRLLGRLCQKAPVVLVIEDLHWADQSTLEFLSYLLRNLRDERLLLVATWRSDELPRSHPVRRWLAEQHRSSRMEELDLQRFSRAELAEQLAGILGSPPPALVEQIFVRSEGNPFFAEELAAASAHGLGARLPSRLRDVLLVRVGDCSPEAQAMLRVAAAAGHRVDERLLAAVATADEAELLTGLREAVDQQLLVVSPDEDAYVFRHALLQEAVYGELLPGERTRLHAALARALAERVGWGEPGQTASAAEIAGHCYRAHDLPNALAWSARAAVEADAMHAYAEALRHSERVLELWDRVSHAEMRAGMDRVEVLRRAAQAALAIDNGDLALALIDQALREVDPVAEPVRAGLLHERRGVCLEGVTWDDAPTFEAFREAVRLIPADPPTRERARVLASFAEVLFRAGHDEQAHAAGEEALAIARRLGAERELGEALIAVGWTQAARGAIDAGIGSLREAVRLADKHADPHVLAHACGWLGEVLLRAGRLEDAVEVSLSGREPLRRLGLAERWHDNVLLVKAAEALFKLGRWDEADSLARQALAQARPEERCNGHGVAMHEVHMVATLEIARGDFRAAEAHLAAIKDRMLGSVPKFARGYAELLAEVRAWQGRLDQAQAAVQQGLDLVAGTGEQVRSGRLLCLGMRVAADLAEQARARRDPEGVEAALHAANGLAAQAAAMTPNPLVPGASPVVTAGAVGALSDGERSRLAGRSDPARWRATATAWLTLRRPYPAAYAQWRLAEALLEQKQPPNRAAEPLRQAHAAAQRLGARPLLDEVTALARRARIALEEAREEAEPATPSQLEQLGLTEREVEVLEYVAAGRSNREIGEALFISAKTASVHVSNILRKLGVTSRVQAATVAHRLGLFDKQPPEEQGVG